MLRTQDAAMYAIGERGMTALCEAICLDAVEVTDAQRIGIWFFGESGELVCRCALNTGSPRFERGAVIPAEAAEIYLDAARNGPMSVPVVDESVAFRLELLVVDSHDRPAAMLRIERRPDGSDWRPRDLTILREMARILAGALRVDGLTARSANYQSPVWQGTDAGFRPMPGLLSDILVDVDPDAEEDIDLLMALGLDPKL